MTPLELAKSVARGIIPFRASLRRLKRSLVAYTDDPGNSAYCITNGLEQLCALQAAGVEVRGARVLEFGTGWLPLIPMLFHLAGARRMVLTDIERLMDKQTIARARSVVAGRMDDVAAVLRQPRDALMARLDEPFAHDYLVPWKAASHPAEDVDLVISRAALEHVPEERLRFFVAQFHRILRPGAVMCHVIDNSDHWQHRDRSLSRVNFLRYEENDRAWRLSQLDTQGYQNRLRHDDYARLFSEAGFEILRAEGEPDAKCLDDLGHIPLASRFRGRDPKDLAVLLSLFVARKR